MKSLRQRERQSIKSGKSEKGFMTRITLITIHFVVCGM